MKYLSKSIWRSALFSAIAASVAAQPIDPNNDDNNATSPTTTPNFENQAAPVKPIISFTTETATSGESVSSYCTLQSEKKLPRGALVVLIRKVNCRYNNYSGSTSFYAVLHEGKERLVYESSLLLPDSTRSEVQALTAEQIDANRSRWEQTSRELSIKQLSDALDALNATKKHGIAILDTGIFDISEHTEGTGFRIKVVNTGRKTIKYITVGVTGLNSVKDPVRDRYRGTSAMTFRGIGPIEPDTTATYSKDYFWMTDLVEYFKITQIRLEFMDGSSKTLTNIDQLKLKPTVVELLKTVD